LTSTDTIITSVERRHRLDATALDEELPWWSLHRKADWQNPASVQEGTVNKWRLPFGNREGKVGWFLQLFRLGGLWVLWTRALGGNNGEGTFRIDRGRQTPRIFCLFSRS
jgi:hypothetical protein